MLTPFRSSVGLCMNVLNGMNFMLINMSDAYDMSDVHDMHVVYECFAMHEGIHCLDI